MLKRVQKEVRELKKKSAKKHKKIIRYQIVSTYFLNGAFKVLSEVVFYSFFFVRNTTRFFVDSNVASATRGTEGTG